MTRKHSSGFTLIELIVVMAIVAILAAIALPSFADQMRKSRRAEAVTAIQDAQLRLERWRVDHNSYAGSGVAIPASSHYTFTITAAAATPNNYSVSAAPTINQAKDKCGTMTITSALGIVSKTPTDTGCW
ncbi:MAG: prepilin-type N-terminal cleavage/methylation domain-containing protein [Lysobacter sp.]|nr:prepilin-type N-terminal cleavage/methylation domain-containing protein [Lysobacter sp.]